MSRRLAARVALLVLSAGLAFWYRSQVFGDSTPIVRPNIVFVTGGSNSYWQVTANGARTAAKDLNVYVDVRMPKGDEDIKAQTQILFDLDLENIDGVAISPLDAEEQTRKINQLTNKALVVTFDSDAPFSNRLSYIGSGNVSAGKQCANLVMEAIPNGDKIAVLLANLTKDNMQERKIGFDETISHSQLAHGNPAPKYEVVDYLIDGGDRQQCESGLRQLLTSHNDLDCIVGMNAYHGPILLRVLNDVGRLGAIKLVTFDTMDDTLAGLEAGKVFATVAQDPYEFGYQAIQILSSYCRRRDQLSLPLPGVQSTTNIKTHPVRKANVEEFRRSFSAQLKGELNEMKSS